MTSKWIWYYGDFEIYHSLKVQTRREEYDYYFPPFWKLDDCWHNVNFTKEVELESPAEMTVYAHGNGHVEIDGRLNSYKIGKAITVPAGKHKIIVQVANVYGLPCIYSDSDAILTDESWKVSCYGEEWVNAGCNDYYTDKNDNPQEFKFCYEEIIPVSKKKTDNGMLYDFGRETFAKLCFDRQDGKIDIFYGESEAEALDTENTYLKVYASDEREQPCRAFRYLYIRGDETKYSFKAYYEYLPLENKGSFKCSDELLNKIWDTSVYTLHLNS